MHSAWLSVRRRGFISVVNVMLQLSFNRRVHHPWRFFWVRIFLVDVETHVPEVEGLGVGQGPCFFAICDPGVSQKFSFSQGWTLIWCHIGVAVLIFPSAFCTLSLHMVPLNGKQAVVC